ncbi:AraC family transcriptional regulator [Bacillus paralicheniformis]|uniref:AraC family transcriptional regulator n=1 Tax=Bacillus paralicheniformis TaxID=1648923 RepID=UPI00128B3C93|nr:AraC family transcriptional regulator [Bacillus paralicheniformis]MPQ26749.1 helix-turn-helix domain-containing protein [Bacillus paralicheniformis]
MTQYFVNENFNPSFENGLIPKLLYICNVDDAYTRLPRTMHMHEDVMEIIFVKEGSGNQLIGEKVYKIAKNDILIYNNGVLHDEYANPEANLSVFCCGITNLKLSGLPENHLISSEHSCVIQSGELAASIQSLLEMMYTQISGERPGAEEICSYLLRSLITLILQIPKERAAFQKTEESNLSNRIKTYIDKHYLENITLQSLSQTFHISSYYLVHVFKKSTGFSPIQYIIRRRIGEAQSLLINTDESVTKIAGMVGYDNTSYFTTLFTKIVGIPPKKYRRLWTK